MANEEKAHLKSLGDVFVESREFKWNTLSA
jgi:hypothetical protein